MIALQWANSKGVTYRPHPRLLQDEHYEVFPPRLRVTSDMTSHLRRNTEASLPPQQPTSPFVINNFAQPPIQFQQPPVTQSNMPTYPYTLPPPPEVYEISGQPRPTPEIQSSVVGPMPLNYAQFIHQQQQHLHQAQPRVMPPPPNYDGQYYWGQNSQPPNQQTQYQNSSSPGQGGGRDGARRPGGFISRVLGLNQKD
jgi:hypothetical protein